MNITELEPASLWRHFAGICEIPHPSGHEEGIREYIRRFAGKHKLACREDAAGNIMIRRAASPGMEKAPKVIMQAHMDMVPQKNAATVFDFLSDPIRPRIVEGWVTSGDTTLGADNGIGLAAGLAILEADDQPRGPLAALFTAEEETGLNGAANVDREFLHGDILLNLDSGDGTVVVGCAGGSRTTFAFNYDREPAPAGHVALRLSVSGLLGGHSGVDIGKNRLNAIKTLSDLLLRVGEKFDFRLLALNGGTVDNAIPREAFADLLLPEDQEMEFAVTIKDFAAEDKVGTAAGEPGFNLSIATISEFPACVLERGLQDTIVTALSECPDGVMEMSRNIPGFVHSSSNLGVIRTENNAIRVTILQRSADNADRDRLVMAASRFFEGYGGVAEYGNSYPGWNPDPAAALVRTFAEVYRNLFGINPEIKAVHAGLECGIFKNFNPGLDIISFGPMIVDAHSPDERVNIESVSRFYRTLATLLTKLCES